MRAFFTWTALIVAALLSAAIIYGLFLDPAPPGPKTELTQYDAPLATPAASPQVIAGAATLTFTPPPAAAPTLQSCLPAPGRQAAAASNAGSLTSSAWLPFQRGTGGWEIYLPLVQREIGTACGADQEAFAEALAQWQKAHHLQPTGVMDQSSFDTMGVIWLRRRPFVQAMARGCPAPPPPENMVAVAAGEGYGGKDITLRPGTLQAWRQMVAAARREEPAIAADPSLLSIISGFREPLGDEIRCALSADCGVARAPCSAHRTGLATDLYLGAAPGSNPASTEDANRLWQSRTVAYRWMMRNADRFGFVNYPYEPWHWEWTGEAP